ncbi:MAG: carbohydrate kinase family protein [Anaerolineaceae bacterium]|nr:carbohydrate kinase family protein [Anaerolineaceae bacterium]
MGYDALVYGPLFCDVIFTGMDTFPTLGTEIFAQDLTIAIGGSAIIAAGLHRLGAKVGLIADLGNDRFSRIAADLLDELGIDRTLIRQHDYPLPQLTVALSYPHDRAFITRFEKPTEPPDLKEILREHPSRHLHVCSFLAAYDALNAVEIAHGAGTTVSFDPGWDEDALKDETIHRIAAEVDIFMPSRSELCYMMGEDDTETALQKALGRMSGGAIVMKNSAEGVLARSATQSIAVPALPVTPIDTTGAGDAFDAGFIYGLVNDYSLEDCCRYGAVCGALATTAVGGATGTPTHEEVKTWLSKLPS